MNVDILTAEVIQSALVSVCKEMSLIVRNSAYSRVLNEGKDFSCAILDARGQLVGIASDSPGHIFPLRWSTAAILEKFGGSIEPGDIFVVNDPDSGGTHLNDVAMLAPVFLDSRLCMFSCVRAHWADIGGMVPGSLSGRATEIFQEGLRIPPVRTRRAGQDVPDVLDLIFGNVRQSDERRGDFAAMVSGCQLGIRRVKGLLAEHGVEMFDAALAYLMERAERRMRMAIREKVRPGSYYHEEYLDSAGAVADPVPICVRVDSTENGLEIDFAGTAPMVAGPVNCTLAVTNAAAFVAIKSLVDPESPVNQGAFSLLSVKAPEGLVVSAVAPAACGGYSEVKARIQSTIMGALARGMIGDVAGDHKGTANHFIISGGSGSDMTLLYEFPAGGSGGTADTDGPSAFCSYDEGDFVSIQSIEVVEHDNPILVRSLKLRTDSGGAGRYRGGLGLERTLVPQRDGLSLSILSDRNVLKPYGVGLGLSGAPNAFQVLRNGASQHISDIPGKVMSYPLQKEDLVVARSGGGGGYGDPLERPAQLVLDDIDAGYVSPAAAAGHYGIIIGSDGLIDRKATDRQRATLRARRRNVAVVSNVALNGRDRGRRRAWLSGADAGALGLGEDDVFEIGAEDRAPIRLWAGVSAEVARGAVNVGADLLSLLGVPDGATVVIRKM